MTTQETLTDLRHLLALKQSDLGVHEVSISRIENGVAQASAQTIRRIAAIMDLPIERVSLACQECRRRAVWTAQEPAP